MPFFALTLKASFLFGEKDKFKVHTTVLLMLTKYKDCDIIFMLRKNECFCVRRNCKA